MYESKMLSKSTLAILLFLSALSIAAVRCSDDSDIHDRLTQFEIDDEVGFETDMLNFLDQSHHFVKAKRDAGSIAVKRVAILQANLANIKHAIKRGVAEIAKTILDDYKLAADKNHQEEDANEVSAVLARVFVRAQVTVIDATATLWKHSYKLIEQYRDARGMNDLLSDILARLEKDPISVDRELEFQREILSKFKFSDILSESNFLQVADKIIDDAFACHECSRSGRDSASTELSGIDLASPLATGDRIEQWVTEYVDEDYLEKVRRSEEHIKGLIQDAQPDEWQSFKLGDISAKLQELAA